MKRRMGERENGRMVKSELNIKNKRQKEKGKSK
jgi:hypothetical protein